MKVSEIKETLVKTSRNWITYILAMVLIISSAYHIFAVLFSDSPDEMDFLERTYSAVIGIIMAEFILFDPKRSVLRSVGFYALSISISRIIQSITILIHPSLFSLVFGSILLFTGANLFFSGYQYLNGTSRGRTGMMAATTLLAVVQILMIMIFFQTDFLKDDYNSQYELLPSIITLTQYVVLLMILDTGELRYGSVREQANTKIETVRKTHVPTADCLLNRDDAAIMKDIFTDRSSWTSVDDGGPVESEIRINLIDDRVSSCMIIQKWKGDKKLYATVTGSPDGSIILANRFAITGVYADDELTHVYLMNDSGIAACFAVAEEETEEGSDEEA